ncbi:MAG: hypothetical protein K2I74_06605 [Treponemataceae bacterium]|nr:hypothetical protein [Treponemataceae bacterium]
MKKHILTAACLATMLAFVATACHEVIFYEIRQEVKLADAQVSGDINSIVRFGMDGKEYLFVQSGNIYCKELNRNAETGKPEPTMSEPYEGQWKKADKGIIGTGNVIRLAADETYLYALAVRIEEDEDEGENYPAEQTLYCSTDGNEWKKIDLTLPPKGPNTLFCTNSPNPAHRKAFLNVNKTVYELNGETAAKRDDISDDPKSCVWFNGDVTFSASGAATTNETADTDPTLWYEGIGKDIFTYSTSDRKNPDHKKEIGYAIHSLACTKDFLLAGTDDGLLYFGLDNGLPTGTTDSETNVSSTLSSYYEVHNVLAVDPSRPSKKGDPKGGDIYGTTVFDGTSSNTGASADNQGLWAYYPGRGHWNRE